MVLASAFNVPLLTNLLLHQQHQLQGHQHPRPQHLQVLLHRVQYSRRLLLELPFTSKFMPLPFLFHDDVLLMVFMMALTLPSHALCRYRSGIAAKYFPHCLSLRTCELERSFMVCHRLGI